MLKHISVIMVLGILVLTCDSSKRPQKPDNLISKNQMSELLYDLYVVNAAKGVNRKILETNGFIPETYILEKYDVDSTRFAESNTYYAFDSETYKAMVDKVKARLESEKELFEDLKQKETDSIKDRRDSINKKGKIPKESIKIFSDTTSFKKPKLKDL